MKINIIKGILFLLLLSCSSNKRTAKIPTQFNYEWKIKQRGDSTYINLFNPLNCPLRFFPKNSADERYNAQMKKLGIITLKPLNDTILKILNRNQTIADPPFFWSFGDIQKKINKNEISLPFPKGKKYRVIQGYLGEFSHNTKYSSYALDFELKEGDVVSAADDGFVVGVIKKHNKHGNDVSWTGFANFITLYHPKSGLFTQYVHLKKNGSLVKVGDRVKKGQAIGFSGNTGFTDGPHLHFNVLHPVDSNEGLISTPIVFDNNIKGENLIKGTIVTHE